MRRRTLLAAAATSLAPRIGRAADARTLRLIPQADLAAVDPVWTSVYVTRNHGYMVWDTLYGQDSHYRATPQMVEGHQILRDGLEWRLTLREGLRFHDGEPVRAQDCVASIARWSKRDAWGQTLAAQTDELAADGDRTVVFRLKQPAPWLPDALGKIGINMLPIMPERLARTDPFKQVTEVVGSGPFRYLADERVAGARVAYARFEGYQPRPSGTPDWTSGPKRAWFDRVEWTVIPDPATANAALRRGEVDWWEQPIFDLLPDLARDKATDTSVVEVTGNVGLLRFNALHPPFDDPAIRRALLPALDQADFMTAVAGDDRQYWRTDVGVFAPGTPMANESGLAAIAGPRSTDLARQRLAAAGYKGEPVVLLTPGDYPRINALCLVAADMLKRCGMTVDLQVVDWASVIRRRASRAKPGEGGWSLFITTLTGADLANPASNPALRGNGDAGWFGWPRAPRLEALRADWLAAPDDATRRTLAADIQAQAFEDVPFLPLGQFFQPTATRGLTGLLRGMPLFWNVSRA